jgi:4-alpha-glucanotransferase
MIPGAEYERLSLATFATHDHPPLRKFWGDWVDDCGDEDKSEAALRGMKELLNFCGFGDLPVPQPFTPEIHAALIRGLFACNSWMTVLLITDLFGLTDQFNVPGAFAGANWSTRIAGTPSEWDAMYPAQLEACVAALKETGRLRQESA